MEFVPEVISVPKMALRLLPVGLACAAGAKANVPYAVRLTRYQFIMSFLCPCAPVKMVYSLFRILCRWQKHAYFLSVFAFWAGAVSGGFSTG